MKILSALVMFPVALLGSAVSCAAGAPEAGSPGGSPTGRVGTQGEGAAPAVLAAAGRKDAMGGEAVAVLGGGCFWCLEAAYELVPGVLDVESGYSGGTRTEPTYEQVSTGLTGHAEVVRIRYDPAAVSYDQLLDLFFKIHDPTTLDRQGADIGSQYRSVILYDGDGQRERALAKIAELGPAYASPIVTAVKRLGTFWPAEAYHQDFYRKNPDYGYCQVVVAPKVQKAKSFVEALPPAKPKP